MSIASIAISSALSTTQVAAANQPAPVQTAPVQPVTSSADTVTLTDAQQVFQLYTQGQTVTEIAGTLSLPVELVNSYLGISS
jgi:DNA-binding CsgD family transcriptional regulator